MEVPLELFKLFLASIATFRRLYYIFLISFLQVGVSGPDLRNIVSAICQEIRWESLVWSCKLQQNL